MGMGSPEDPAVLVLKINTHASVCGKWKVLSPRGLSANGGRLHDVMPALDPSYPLLIVRSVFLTRSDS